MSQLTLSIKHGKDSFEVQIESTATLNQLRQVLHEKTEVAPGLQKIMSTKGTLKDEDKTLQDLGITDKSKLMLVGSKISDVMKISAATEKAASAPPPTDQEKDKQDESINFDELPHKKIVEAGPPADAMPAYGGLNEPLPQNGISGLVNKASVKFRLTFKTATDELWISTQQTTQKIPFASISDIKTFPIPKHENYLAAMLVMGTSKYHIYWIPAQYIRAMKIAVLGYQG
eukprot:TRINITY_DN4286_c0_g1_i1.p1 TRINITY_DN4286_c0_g1~~TRINITY_DN4286_c0_g1_i1.p1  ORF type:complete len:230 (+),score=49.40 TRINITY_DN4286_c0_g1_i1:47-736(+)